MSYECLTNHTDSNGFTEENLIVASRRSRRISAVSIARAATSGALWGLLAVQLALGDPFEPFRLTDVEGNKYFPKIWGDSVIWTDYRDVASGMYQYRFSTGEESRFMSTKLGADFRGDVISYGPVRPTTYNLNTNTYHTLTSQSVNWVYTALGDEWAAWSSSAESYQYDVYARRIQPDGTPVGDVVQITDWDGVETEVDTEGEYVVWEARHGSNPSDIWLRDMLTGDSQRLGTGSYPVIGENHVVWTDDGLWAYDIADGTAFRISDVGAVENPGIWGDQVVWMNGGHLYGYNLSSGDSFIFDLPSRPGYTTPRSYSPSIYGDMVVWVQTQRLEERGSYIDDLYAMQIPEPSACGLLSLGGAMMLLPRRLRPNSGAPRR